MTNRIDPFNSPAEDINGTANDDMVIMDNLAADDPRTMAFGVSPNIEIFDDSRFHSISYDELDREADEDFLPLESGLLTLQRLYPAVNQIGISGRFFGFRGFRSVKPYLGIALFIGRYAIQTHAIPLTTRNIFINFPRSSRD